MTFIEFVESEMEKREWTRADLSRKSGISQPQITRVLNGAQSPGDVFIDGIARAFDLPVDIVYRAARELPADEKRSELEKQAVYWFEKIESEETKRKVVDIIKLFTGDDTEPRGKRAKP
jgi:transcriptional regulator with XRE-family HTH domain